MLKKLFLLTLLFVGTLYAFDVRLNNYPDMKAKYDRATKELNQSAAFDLGLFYKKTLHDYDQSIYWYKRAYTLGSSGAAYNLGSLYQNMSKYNEALDWYKKAANKGDIKAPRALGLLYEDHFKAYDNSIHWYEEAYKIGDVGGANNLGFLYEMVLKQPKQAIKWYIKAAKEGHADAIKNLGNVYHDQGSNIKGAAYIFAMANYGYSKDEVLDFLKNDWKLDHETLKKAYKLQQTLDIPKHYTGGID